MSIREHRRPSPGAGLALLCAVQFLLILDVAVVNVALPAVQDDLGFSASALQLVVTAYTLAFGGLLLFGGRAADVLGRRRMLIAGLLIFTIGLMACGLATSAVMLVLARAVQGAGAAVAAPAALALLSVLFPDGPSRVKALGIWSALAAAGGAAGLLLGGLLTQLVGWRYIFLINIVGGFLVAAAPRLLPEPARAGGRIDAAGAVLVTAGVVGIVYAVTLSADVGLGSPLVAAASIGAAGLIGAFVVRQRRVDYPLLPLTLFRGRSLTGANLAALLMSPVVVGVNYFVTLHLQQVAGLSPLQTGLAFLPLTLISAASSIGAARAAARFGTRPVLVTGLLLIAAGAAVLTGLAPDSGYATTILPALILVAAGLGPGFTLTTLAALSDVPDARQGAASGLLSTSQQLGGAVGLAALVAVATSTDGRGPETQLTATAGTTAAFVIMAALAFFAAVAVVVLVRPARRPGGPMLHDYPVAATSASPSLPCQPTAQLITAGSDHDPHRVTSPRPHRPD